MKKKQYILGVVFLVVTVLLVYIMISYHIFFWMSLAIVFQSFLMCVIWKGINKEKQYEVYRGQIRQALTKLGEGKYHKITTKAIRIDEQQHIAEMNDSLLKSAKIIRFMEYSNQQFNHILNTLHLGVALVNKHEEVIYLNEDCQRIFKIRDFDKQKKTYLVFRNHQLLEAIQKAIQYAITDSLDIFVKQSIYLAKVYPIIQEDETKQQAVLIVFKDVTEMRQLETTKRDFVAHASHELKSPLTAILGYLDLIKHQMIEPHEMDQMVEQMAKQGKHMNALIEDMLMLSRLETKVEEDYQEIRLDHLLKQVIDMHTYSIETKKIQLTYHISDVSYQGIPSDFTRLFKNLLENAIFYTDEMKGHIRVSLKSTAAGVLFEIEDNGIGIEKGQQERIFERFYRIDKGRLEEGTGLGLAIVKHIVLKYKGSIEVESELGIGTLFIVRL